jgi:PAS domain S-box-containing protein
MRTVLATETRTPRRRGAGLNRLSTAQTLSLITAGIVLVVLAAALVVVRHALTQSALDSAQDRLDRSVRQLTAVTASNMRATRLRYLAVAQDSAVVSSLRAGRATAGVETTLKRLGAPTDSGLPIELWSANGRRLAFVGDDINTTVELQVPSEAGQITHAMRPGLDSIDPVDSLQAGTLARRDGNRTGLWLAMPVIVDSNVLGFILQARRIARNPQTERTIRELSGNSATAFYHNVDGSTWTTLGGEPVEAPSAADSDHTRIRRGVGRVMYAEERIPGTPLVMEMEVPRAVVVARPQAVVRQLASYGFALTVLGAILALVVGQRVMRPLTGLTTAAEDIAGGDYSRRVPHRGTLDVSRLTGAFNFMATQVGEARRALEMREAELRTLANTMPQIAWTADTDGRVHWFNDRWYEFTGETSTADQSVVWWSSAAATDVDKISRAWRAAVERGESFELEVRLRSAHGELRWFLTRAAPLRDHDGGATRWFGTSTDIQSLKEAREAAEAASRAKTDFLAAMSHELRTPLNAIGGYTELMEMGLRGPISDNQRRDLIRIRTNQQHLLGLIGSVLDLNRIESGRVTFEHIPIAVDAVLTGLEALVAPQADAKQQTLTLRSAEAALVVIADREKLRQVMLNLLSNAIRHSPPGSTITVSAERCDARIAIAVADDGPGIPEAHHEAIFEPFVQVGRSLRNPTEGVGLGLAISRDLARGMGGDLTVRSVAGEGATFTLTLPAGSLDEATDVRFTAEFSATPS